MIPSSTESWCIVDLKNTVIVIRATS
uniref:GSVIVT01015456001 n=1 Tax=Arundo donax TaxID=35708 RepID=A0A0A8XNA5_ARUDO